MTQNSVTETPHPAPLSANSHPDLMTEVELIEYLRIPELSNAKNAHNVIENLKRARGLPVLHICNKALYPLQAVRQWVAEQTKE